MLSMAEDYERKVREIALLQCRCDAGAEVDADRPASDEQAAEDQPARS